MSFGYDPEAIYQDADIEQREFEEAGRLIAHARQLGRCTHQSTVGYRERPLFRGQEGLEPGQFRCADGCDRVFNSNDEWADAVEEAIHGD